MDRFYTLEKGHNFKIHETFRRLSRGMVAKILTITAGVNKTDKFCKHLILQYELLAIKYILKRYYKNQLKVTSVFHKKREAFVGAC